MRTVLMATRDGGDGVEAEPVVVDTGTPGAVVIELDDGGRLELDERELRGALESRKVPTETGRAS